MPEYFIRRMEVSELKNFYKRIERDFLPEEHAPYQVLYRQLQMGIQEAMVFCEGAQDLAYCVCAAGHAGGYVLISLLAVFEEYRGQGIGSAFLEALRVRYEQNQALLVEVERPELSKTSEERCFRQRRIEFYKRAGFYLIPGIDYTIWDVPMHLMALPIMASRETINQRAGQIMYQIYLKLMGERFIHKMRCETLNSAEEVLNDT
ncbi:MAG: GNAT family N-acetyltransferase [Clostridiales bacterium]|jgi:GNAT superfamily N-acetyltransferase|nr:GNAT family N-acetyltransferase [Eubacteriales bacterium]MDH7565328.1 GNAT family N-acetyltransferase [Clostridiales bacterium]